MVSSTPAAGSTVETSPPSLLLTFANPLGATNTVQVACNGSPIAVGSPAVGLDGVSLSVTVPNPLPKGECVVSWQVSQPDAQSGGSSSFLFTIANDTVGTGAPAVTTPGAGSVPATASTTAPTANSSSGGTTTPGTGSGGPLGLSRLLISLGVAVLFGSLVLIATAWARRRRVHPSFCSLPPLGLVAHTGLCDLQRRMRDRGDHRQGDR